MGKRRNQEQTDPRGSQLQAELHSTGQALRDAYDKFNYVSEPELVDACVYEISALKARYSYLLRCIKEGGEHTAPAVCAAAAGKGGPACLS